MPMLMIWKSVGFATMSVVRTLSTIVCHNFSDSGSWVSSASRAGQCGHHRADECHVLPWLRRQVKAQCSLLHTNIALHWVGGEADRADEVMSRVVELGAHVTITTHIMCGDPEGSAARGDGEPERGFLRRAKAAPPPRASRRSKRTDVVTVMASRSLRVGTHAAWRAG